MLRCGGQTPEFVRFVDKMEIRREIINIFHPFDKDKPAGEGHLVERRLQGLVNFHQNPLWRGLAGSPFQL